MPRSVTRPKKSPHRVKQKATKPKHQKVARPNVFDHSVLDYDPSETQFSNYKQLGLLADANTIGAARSTITGFKPRNLGQPCADPTPEGGVHPLKNEVCEKRYVHRTLKPVDTAAALASGSAPRPPLPQPRARVLPLVLGSSPSPFEATRQPSSGPLKAEDLRPNRLTGMVPEGEQKVLRALLAKHGELTLTLTLTLTLNLTLTLTLNLTLTLTLNLTLTLTLTRRVWVLRDGARHEDQHPAG